MLSISGMVAYNGRVSHHYHEFFHIGLADRRIVPLNFVFVMRLPVGHRVVLAEVTHYRNFVLGFLLA